jgi:hypothetical protein
MRIPIPVSYSFDYNYKLYDHLNGGKFYDIYNDPLEKVPIRNTALTAPQKSEKTKLKNVLKSYAGS